MQHASPAHPNHSTHDAALLAGHAAGDLADSERARAQALLDGCAPCAELHRDLIAIAAATRGLPHLAPAPRDFRLSVEQAARLRRGSWIRAALRPFASPRSTIRPLAAAFTSLGIAGVFVVTILPGLLGGPAALSTGAERDNLSAGGPPSSLVPVAAPGATRAGQDAEATFLPDFWAVSQQPNGPDSVDPQGTKVDPAPTAPTEGVIANGNQSPDTEDSTDGGRLVTTASPPNPILVGSLALLTIGVLLFGLRFAARRVR